MQTSFKLSFLLVLTLSLFSCKKKEDDKNLYQVNEVGVLPNNGDKTKMKTNEQYVSILYANLFQKALSPDQIFELSQCMESIGDQELAREVIISNFLNKPGIIKPSHVEMWSNLDQFIINTYNRFLVRNPTEAEKTYFKNYITANSTVADSSNVSPEIIYFSFALSNEYMFY